MTTHSLNHPSQKSPPAREIKADDASSYIISFYSSTETESDLPGAGRNLGNLYSSLGRRLENGVRAGKSIVGSWLGRDTRINNTQASPTQKLAPVRQEEDDEGSFFLGSVNSFTATKSNLTGAGRKLGNFYSFAGRYVESGASMIAVRTGFCPRAVAVRTRKILQTHDTKNSSTRRKIERSGSQLIAYTSSNVASTQEAALDELIRLCCEDEYFRRLIKDLGLRSLGLLRYNPRIWYNLPKPIQTQAERAIIALADENANIKDLVWSLKSKVIFRFWPFIRKELRHYLLHDKFSFVVVRNIGNAGVNATPFSSTNVARLLAESMAASHQYMEWSELDKVFSQLDSRALSGVATNEMGRFDIVFKNADKLPLTMNSAAMRDWFSKIESAFDTESTSKNVMVRAYAAFSTMILSVDNRDQDQHQIIDSNILRIYQKLASPANRALSLICRSSFHRAFEGDNEIETEFRKLAELVDSQDVETRKEALLNARLALSADRYIRQSMLSALVSTQFFQSNECASVLEESRLLCKPPDCPGRETPMSVCRMHSDIHSIEIYRHCDEHGNVIHLMRMFDTCDGECGGCAEHSAEVDPSDTISLYATRNTRLQHAPYHYPFYAGTIDKDGRKKKTYVFSLRDQNDLEFFGHGVTVRSAQFFRRDFAGVHTLTGIFNTDKNIYIPVLKYDPDAYYLCEFYKTKREMEKEEMDPTGPYSWKFRRSLSPGGSGPMKGKAAVASSSLSPGSKNSRASTSPSGVTDSEKAHDQNPLKSHNHKDVNANAPLVEPATESEPADSEDSGAEQYYDAHGYFSDSDNENGEDGEDGVDSDGWATADEGSESDFDF